MSSVRIYRLSKQQLQHRVRCPNCGAVAPWRQVLGRVVEEDMPSYVFRRRHVRPPCGCPAGPGWVRLLEGLRDRAAEAWYRRHVGGQDHGDAGGASQ